ncbi:MAG TPA: hypothetical protein VGX76_00335 [Pirellulales bacterium]|jgi:hypothetical protein|nr:hypothetical protein [Pirellulales bacterium]
MPKTHAKAAASSDGKTDLAPLAGALTPVELHAIAQVGKQAAKLRDRLAEENGQEVDVTVRISGAIHVAPGQTTTREEHPSAEALLAFLLSELNNSTRDRLAELARIAHVVWLTGGGEPEVTPAAQAAAQDFLRKVTRQANKHVRGSVTGAITCKLVSRR